MPLLEDVGLAVIDYLKFGRPKSDSSPIFLSHRPPVKDFNSSSLYGIVNVPLPVISEILGHTATETTAVYLTIGIDQLRRCALEVRA